MGDLDIYFKALLREQKETSCEEVPSLQACVLNVCAAGQPPTRRQGGVLHLPSPLRARQPCSTDWAQSHRVGTSAPQQVCPRRGWTSPLACSALLTASSLPAPPRRPLFSPPCALRLFSPVSSPTSLGLVSSPTSLGLPPLPLPCRSLPPRQPVLQAPQPHSPPASKAHLYMKKETVRMLSRERLPTTARTSSVEKWSAQVAAGEIWVREQEEEPSNSPSVN